MVDPIRLSLPEPAGAGVVPLFTLPGGLGLYRRGVELALRLDNARGGVEAEALMRGCVLRLDGSGDAFLAQLLGSARDSHGFDVGLRWSARDGVSFIGSSALELRLPLAARTPVVALRAVHVALRPQGAALGVELSADLDAKLAGLIDVSIERLGIDATLHLTGAGAGLALGPLASVELAFKPPAGAGLALNLAGLLKGGGLLRWDAPRGQYAGLLSLQLLGLGVTAVGIVTTRPGFSLLAVITTSFEPVGLDIGLGFTVNAVGGLLGLHRGTDLHALADAVRHNRVDSLLFPRDPEANAGRIVSDLDRLFPRVENQFLVGPMFKLGWGKPAGIFTLAMGVVVQLPDPRIDLLGVFKALVLPSGEPLLRLQVNFAGSLDPAARMLSLDGSLVDSGFLGCALQGDMSARLRWGQGADFVASAGGFNPAYVPAADLALPPLKRLSIDLAPPVGFPRLRLEAYCAVTSNTLQHGARAAFESEVLGFGLRAHLGYDVLVQLDPPRFAAALFGSVAILAFGEELAGCDIELRLEGPDPIVLSGSVRFKPPLLPRQRIPVKLMLGARPAVALPDVDLLAEFNAALANARHWAAPLPPQDRLQVILSRKLEPAAGSAVLAHPSSPLQFDQATMPLGVRLQRFGAARPRAAASFDLRGLGTGAPQPAEERTREFAPAQFFDLDADSRLSMPAFKPMRSGLNLPAARMAAAGTACTLRWRPELGVRDEAGRDGLGHARGRLLATAVDDAAAALALAGGGLAGSAIGRARHAALPGGSELRVAPASWRVVDALTLEPLAGVPALGHPVAAEQARQERASAEPALAGRLVVMAAHDID